MKNPLLFLPQKTIITALILLCTSGYASATTYLLGYIDPPWPSSSRQLSAINNRGLVGGLYYFEGVGYSFIYDGFNFTRLAYNPSGDESPVGFTNIISMNDDNIFALTHEDQGVTQNYLYADGVYSPFVIAEAADATIHEITNQQHFAIQQAESTFLPPFINVHSYIYDGETLLDISIENEFMTFISGLNDSNMAAGSYISLESTYQLFTFLDNQYVFYDFPKTKEPMQKITLNNWGMICGNYYNGVHYEAFMLDSSTGLLSSFADTPFQVNGINDAGQLAGSIIDGETIHGLLATPFFMDSDVDADSDGSDLVTLAINLAGQSADQGDLLNFSRNFGGTHHSMHLFKTMDSDGDGDTDGRDISALANALTNYPANTSTILNVAQNFGRTLNIIVTTPL